jgi:catechol 2,3-dioxygenase-like lactoylglutathione lyase family enzyme
MQLISGLHSIVFSTDADATRAFFRDKLTLPFVDAGHGWLIFALPPAELGVHPADTPEDAGRHQLSLMCSDVEATVAELKAKGVEFDGGVENQGWGLVAKMKVPGCGELWVYQPRHASPLS